MTDHNEKKVPLIALLLVTVWALLVPGVAMGAPQPSHEPVVTVLYFVNHTNDPRFDPLGKGIADMMITDLSKVDRLRIVERTKFEALLQELELQQTAFFDPKTAGTLGRGLGATHAITGAIHAFEPNLRIDIRLVDVQTAEVVMADSVVGPPDAFFELQQQLVQKFTTAFDRRATAPATVPDALSLLDYALALDHADRGDLAQAETVLRSIVSEKPTFELAQDRYLEVLARLRAARQKREDILTGDAKALLESAERYLGNPANRRMRCGYRTLRHQMLSMARGRLLRGQTRVPEGQEPAYRALMRTILDNGKLHLQELEQSTKRGTPCLSSLTKEDEARVNRVGADLRVALMASNWWGTVSREFTNSMCLATTQPSLFALDPTALDEVVETLRHAASVDQKEAPSLHERIGDCLMRGGRKAQAVAHWQQTLERYPTAPEFGLIERKIRAALRPTYP